MEQNEMMFHSLDCLLKDGIRWNLFHPIPLLNTTRGGQGPVTDPKPPYPFLEKRVRAGGFGWVGQRVKKMVSFGSVWSGPG